MQLSSLPYISNHRGKEGYTTYHIKAIQLFLLWRMRLRFSELHLTSKLFLIAKTADHDPGCSQICLKVISHSWQKNSYPEKQQKIENLALEVN